MKNTGNANVGVDTPLVSDAEFSGELYDILPRSRSIAFTEKETSIIKAALISTPLGPMVALADEIGLYLLEFVDRQGLGHKIERLCKKISVAVTPGETAAIKSINKELALYFSGGLVEFKTAVHLIGSEFQKKVWQALQKIPVGETRSYADQAKMIAKPTACRAVANANGMNPLGIIIPCHRVINTNGQLGGYSGGLSRKEWLLQHEHKLR